MYGYGCEYCDGTIQPRLVEREALENMARFVILEDVAIGVCDSCVDRYYSADILHAVHQIATGKRTAERMRRYRQAIYLDIVTSPHSGPVLLL